MSENIDINVGIIKEEISINAANNIVEVNISTAPVTVINPQNYDLSQFTNTSPNPFIQQSSLSSYVPISRIITINGVAQDLSADRSWTISVPSITGLVPYIGANANVNLGEYGLTAGQLTLDTSPTGVATVGTTRWNNTIGSSETTLKGGSVILKNGVDLVARVVNKVTPNATLTKANYTAVRVSGAQGQRLAVAYAQANNDTNSADTLGLVTETIPTNQEGFIITVGQLEGINTTGSLQGESWSDGDVLYLSPTTPGAITNIKPSGITGHIIVIGYVEYAHANNGKIYVKIMNGWELDELHNVYIDPLTLANNNILQYDSSTQLWRNQVLNTGITIGTTAITSGTVGRVLFEGTGNVVQQSSSLFWDSTNNRLGIGTSSPTQALDVVGIIKGTTSAVGSMLSLAGVNNTSLNMSNDSSGRTFVEVIGNTAATSNAGAYFTANGYQEAWFNVISRQASANNKVWRFGNLGQNNYFAIQKLNDAVDTILFTPLSIASSSGNVGINTTTDAGFRLDVNGTARVQGNAQFGTGFYWDNTNNRLGIGTSSPSQALQVVGGAVFSSSINISGGFVMSEAGNVHTFTAPATNRTIRFITNSQSFSLFSTGNFAINTTTDAGFKLDVNGTARVQGNSVIKGSDDTNQAFALQITNLSGTTKFQVGNGSQHVRFAQWQPIGGGSSMSWSAGGGITLGVGINTSNQLYYGIDYGGGQSGSSTLGSFISLNLTPTINQTGASGAITRGIYVNPTLTSAFDFRAIETARGNVVFGNLPTSSAGLPTGAIWNDAGTLKIV